MTETEQKAARHNEIVSSVIKEAGQKILTGTTFIDQLVILESVIAGLYVAAAKLDNKTAGTAEIFLSAMLNGAKERATKLIASQLTK